MSTLVFDFETCGKWNFKSDLKHEDPNQPKPVQLAAVLVDDDLSEISSISALICPNGKWVIPDDAAKIHGISQARADKYGLSLKAVMEVFLQMAEVADKFLAHNIEFDANITRHALFYMKETFDPFEGKELRCTMKASKPILKLPNRSPYIQDAYKFPKLEEVHQYYFNEGIDGAHDALVDVRATVRVYRELCLHYGMTP